MMDIEVKCFHICIYFLFSVFKGFLQVRFLKARLQFLHDIAMILNKFFEVSPSYAFLLWESLFSLNVAWWMYCMFFSA